VKSFAIPIVNLRVPREWRVGRVWLRRPEWLLARIEATRAAPGTSHNEVLERLAVEVRELPWVLAVAEAATDEEARAIVEEHVAVLRLYQRFRYRYVSLDRQTFGLPETIRRIWENFYVLEGEIVIGAGFTQSGVLGPWDFKMEDVDAWPKDVPFAYFESLLGKEPTERSDAENRLITALGIASVSTASLRATAPRVVRGRVGSSPRRPATSRAYAPNRCTRRVFDVRSARPRASRSARTIAPRVRDPRVRHAERDAEKGAGNVP